MSRLKSAAFDYQSVKLKWCQTQEEKDVLKFICMEFTAQEIAQKMEISARTVEAIKDRLMERFGSKNTAGLVFFAVKNNLVD